MVGHRAKIESTVNAARRARDLAVERGSLAAFFWSFEPSPADRPKRLTWPVLLTMAKTPASIALGKDLKGRGFTFVGPTTAYAFMQAMGLVNDHVEGCAIRERAERARARFRRPR
jgi:DNA-3-methyladenine glycosylase I